MEKIGRKTVLLAGGVGGARMAQGLVRALDENMLTIIANVGDDAHFYGLLVCPDIDTLLYTLSDRVDRQQGWGIADDTTHALEMLDVLGAPTWMKLGDGDFGLHIWRSWQLARGADLSSVTGECAKRLGIKAQIVPATHDRLRTRLRTDAGWTDFQDWFVKARCQPAVHEIRYEGAEMAEPGSGALEAIKAADMIVFAPSNPFLSLQPILAIEKLAQAVSASPAPKIGISPLIAGKAVKGPLDKLMNELGMSKGAASIAACYQGLLDGFLVDGNDLDEACAIRQTGVRVLATNIWIRQPEEAEWLAREICSFANKLRKRESRRGNREN